MAEHHHHHHPAGASSWSDVTAEPVRRRLFAVVAAIGIAAVVGLVVWWPRGDLKVDDTALGFGDQAEATVTGREVAPCSYDESARCTLLGIEITSGPATGDVSVIEADAATRTPASTLGAGDGIIVNDGGEQVPPAARYSFADHQRGPPLLVLAFVFALAVVALGRMRGLLALAGIAVTFAVLLGFALPALLHGSAPIGVALTGATVIAYLTLYLAHGVSIRTTVALLGTLGALALTAILAVVSAGAAHLTGLASEESASLLAFAPDLDFRGLVLAAVILGALGVLDDVTVTQVSVVAELHASDPARGARQLYAAGIRVGRDHIASTVNTLVLAYTAAALPLLLLFTQSGRSLGAVITGETVAVEIVQTLVGSLGLVASVPLTTALACWAICATDDGAADVRGTDDAGDESFWGTGRRPHRVSDVGRRVADPDVDVARRGRRG